MSWARFLVSFSISTPDLRAPMNTSMQMNLDSYLKVVLLICLDMVKKLPQLPLGAAKGTLHCNPAGLSYKKNRPKGSERSRLDTALAAFRRIFRHPSSINRHSSSAIFAVLRRR